MIITSRIAFKFLLVVGILFNIIFLYRFRSNIFWDLDVYQNAVNIFNNGGNPYLDLSGFKFVYSPYILILFSYLNTYLTEVFIILYFVTLILFLRNKDGLNIIFFALISSPLFFNDFLMRSLVSGNITIFLHFTLILIAVSDIKNKINIFLIAVTLISVLKPYFAAYFILGLILCDSKREYLIKAAIAFILFVLIAISQLLFYSEMFSDFLFSLSSQVLGEPNGKAKDMGLGFYSYFDKIFDNSFYALIFHLLSIISSAILVFYLLKNIKKYVDADDFKNISLYATLIFIIIMNPRLKVYDYWLVAASSCGLIYLLIDMLDNKMKLLIISIIFIFSVYLFLQFPKHTYLQIYLPALIATIILPFLVLRFYNGKVKRV